MSPLQIPPRSFCHTVSSPAHTWHGPAFTRRVLLLRLQSQATLQKVSETIEVSSVPALESDSRNRGVAGVNRLPELWGQGEAFLPLQPLGSGHTTPASASVTQLLPVGLHLDLPFFLFSWKDASHRRCAEGPAHNCC